MTLASTPVSESRVLTPDEGSAVDKLVDIVENWHDQVHPGVFRFCSEQPCHAVEWAGRYGY